VTAVMMDTMVMIPAMARLGGSKGTANREDGKENEQTAMNHIQKENPKRTSRWAYCAR
jgi:hypothetical protein